MDQNEKIFVHYMNNVQCRKIMSEWMASEAYWRLRSDLSLGSTPTRLVRRPRLMLPH